MAVGTLRALTLPNHGAMLRDVGKRGDRRDVAFLALGLSIAALIVVLALWVGASIIGSVRYGP